MGGDQAETESSLALAENVYVILPRPLEKLLQKPKVVGAEAPEKSVLTTWFWFKYVSFGVILQCYGAMLGSFIQLIFGLFWPHPLLQSDGAEYVNSLTNDHHQINWFC